MKEWSTANDWTNRWTDPRLLYAGNERYILRDQGDKTWAVIDRHTRTMLVKGLKLKDAEGFMKLLKEDG